VFTVGVGAQQVRFVRGGRPDPTVVVTSDPETFVQIGARLTTPFEALAAGDIKIEGSAGAIRRCTRMLGLS
jgi:putative sterol carrier protein